MWALREKNGVLKATFEMNLNSSESPNYDTNGRGNSSSREFTRAMIEDIASQVNIDRSRIFASGFSNGAIMVYRLACDLADQIAAIGPVAAAPATLSCNPSRPVSVIHFHGDADRLNPYEGGTRTGLGDFMSVEDGIALWLRLDACPAQAQESQEGNIIHRIYAPCQQNSSVEL
jgi:polyhydroxybutyrate depolymerase